MLDIAETATLMSWLYHKLKGNAGGAALTALGLSHNDPNDKSQGETRKNDCVFGEITIAGMLAVLGNCGVVLGTNTVSNGNTTTAGQDRKSNTPATSKKLTLLELGAGFGRACLQMFLAAPTVSTIVGVELDLQRYKQGAEACNRLAKQFPFAFSCTSSSSATWTQFVRLVMTHDPITKQPLVAPRTLELRLGSIYNIPQSEIGNADIMLMDVALGLISRNEFMITVNGVKEGAVVMFFPQYQTCCAPVLWIAPNRTSIYLNVQTVDLEPNLKEWSQVERDKIPKADGPFRFQREFKTPDWSIVPVATTWAEDGAGFIFGKARPHVATVPAAKL